MHRRDFLRLLTAAGAAVLPVVASAQSLGTRKRIAVLVPNLVAARIAAFEAELTRQDLVIGRDLVIDYRHPGTQPGAVAAAVAELLALAPDVMMVSSTPATAEVLRQTTTLPIVFVQASDPIGSGFVRSLAQPGGNATGFFNFEASVSGKWLELLAAMRPGLRRPVAIYNPETAVRAGAYFYDALAEAATGLGLAPRAVPYTDPTTLDAVVASIAAEPDAGLIVIPDNTNNSFRGAIIAAAARNRLPAIYSDRVFTTDGGLMAYGIDVIDVFRRAAVYVTDILRGTRPADLPVRGPMLFDFTVNLRTAAAAGISVPPTLLALADLVLE